MIVTYKGADTNNKQILLEGSHDSSESIEDKPIENEKSDYEDGFLGKYYFFSKGTTADGYKTDGVKPSFVAPIKEIKFPNDASFKQIKSDFPTDHFSCEWTGKVQIEQSGKYTFFTKSDDGSRLWINGNQLVDNWGFHGARQRKGSVTLTAGYHDFKATHFENAGGANMIVSYKGPDTDNKKIIL